MKVNIFEAKTNLSKLIQQALVGEEILIANRGEALVKLVPIERKGLKNYASKKGVWSNYDDAFSKETDQLIASTFTGIEPFCANEKSGTYNVKK